MTKRPTIVCLCGSSKFKDQILGVQQRETLKGKIVLQHGFFHHRDMVPINDGEKAMLDELMLRKIDIADEIIVVNIHGYIGESTKEAIAYAEKYGKGIRYEESSSPRPSQRGK